MSELLTDTDLSEEQQDYAENIQRSANALLTVINDILDLSKVESGRLDIEEVQFSLSVVIGDVSKMMAFAAARKSLEYNEDIQIGLDEDLVVLGDPGRCRQILSNLLTNSIKFTSGGHVKLSAVVESETAESITILFAVEDTGMGFGDDVRQKLFKPFSQADSSTARRFGGTGLGLTICKNLVDLMHGRIDIQSTIDKGTTARFSIPFSKPQFGGTSVIDLNNVSHRLQSDISLSGCGSDQDFNLPSPLHNSTNTPTRHGASQSPARRVPLTSRTKDRDLVITQEERSQAHVLVVEDNPINQQIALKTIKKLGFSTNAVWNGQEALNYLVKDFTPDHPKPDILLMDCQMPELDGYCATRYIRGREPYISVPGMTSIPIIAMTASAIQGDREKCERAGMDDYLAKPVKAQTLEKMLLKWLAPRRGRDGTQTRPDRRIAPDTDREFNCASGSRSPAARPTPPNGVGSATATPPAAALPAVRRPVPEPTKLRQSSLAAAAAAAASIDALHGPDGHAPDDARAEVLRTEKLLAAAAGDDAPRSPASELPPPAPPGAALTEANMGLLGREHAAAAMAGAAVDPLGTVSRQHARGLSDVAEAGGSAMGTDGHSHSHSHSRSRSSTLGELRPPPPGRAVTSQRLQVSRKISDVTVTPDDAPSAAGSA